MCAALKVREKGAVEGNRGTLAEGDKELNSRADEGYSGADGGRGDPEHERQDDHDLHEAPDVGIPRRVHGGKAEEESELDSRAVFEELEHVEVS